MSEENHQDLIVPSISHKKKIRLSGTLFRLIQYKNFIFIPMPDFILLYSWSEFKKTKNLKL